MLALKYNSSFSSSHHLIEEQKSMPELHKFGGDFNNIGPTPQRKVNRGCVAWQRQYRSGGSEALDFFFFPLLFLESSGLASHQIWVSMFFLHLYQD